MQHPMVLLAEAIQRKQPAVLATAVEVTGASPAKVGAQIVLCADGTTAGTAGGGKLEATILADARAALTDGQPRLAHYKLTEEGPDAVGTLCGGELRVFIQPFFPPPRLIIVGGGHIGQPLGILGTTTGFETITIDVDVERAMILGLEGITFTSDTYVVLITTDHIADEAALRQVINSPAPYIGMIGSKRKCRTILDHLRADGCTDETLNRVYAPIGLDLGGTAPEEIAVSILAEIIAVRRGGSAARHSGAGRRITESMAQS
jgi:xanthine dehydrogenase accessory factor